MRVPEVRSESDVRPTLQLPFSRLRHLKALELPWCHLQRTSSEMDTSSETNTTQTLRTSKQQSLAALTALSRLQLEETCLDHSELINCTTLQHLSMKTVSHLTASQPATAAASEVADVPTLGWSFCDICWPTQLTVALPHLTQLTHLDVDYTSFEGTCQVETTISLSRLQQLRVLRVVLPLSHFQVIHLTELPSSLTLLDLENPPEIPIKGMQQLVQLQDLHILAASDTHLLCVSSLTRLTQLALQGCRIRNFDSINQLVMALQHLQHLKVLQLSDALALADPAELYIPTPGSYAALTASTQLTSLQLTTTAFPPGANRFVFSAPVGRLKALKELMASADLFAGPDSFARMVDCCPGLQWLEVDNDHDFDHNHLDLQVRKSHTVC